MESTARTKTSRGTDASVAALLFLLDAFLVGALFYLVMVSHGFDAVPDRVSAARMAGRASAVCAVGAAFTAVPALRWRAWITFTTQLVVLGGSALFFALLTL
ncbi:MAG TPA: transporter [Streptomyces sp.]|uniref:transporter n=1 Tax=Streptomyces sp. TaxID=1931 RepID=UPI002D608081|nr:transporter [Streptomyces sp.]HZG06930.1 transporter [Streptomyces sp.]